MDIIYSLFTFLLHRIFEFSGDWGIAIIILTIMVRTLLLPVSLKQKSSLGKQQELSKKFEAIKETYKNEKGKMDEELAKLTQESSKNMFGCVVTLLQLPILYSLYKVLMKMPMETASIIIPWLTGINLPDPYFIVPALTVVAQLIPGIMASLGVLKTVFVPKLSISQVMVSGIIAVIFFVKAPAALGLYWVTSSLFTSFEQIVYGIFKERWA